MRTFHDSDGREWEAATAFGSYGAVRLIFSRRDGNELRSCDMQAESLRDAERELAACTDNALLERLHTAAPWQS